MAPHAGVWWAYSEPAARCVGAKLEVRSVSQSVAVVGASSNRAKYGNKAVRAFAAQGYTVYPINPREEEVEGLTAYASVADVPGRVDEATFYLPPKWGLVAADAVIAKGVPVVYLNPGAESPELVAKLEAEGVEVIQGCSIIAVGRTPGEFD